MDISYTENLWKDERGFQRKQITTLFYLTFLPKNSSGYLEIFQNNLQNGIVPYIDDQLLLFQI